MSSEKLCKKLVLIWATSTLVAGTREEVVKTAKTIQTTKIGKNGKENKGSEYIESLVQVSYIRYFITFWKKSVPLTNRQWSTKNQRHQVNQL